MNRCFRFTHLAFVVVMCLPATAQGASPSQASLAGDEIGMARELGPATWDRCSQHLSNPDSKSYELSHVRSNTMPLSPFAGAFEITYAPSAGFPGTKQIYNVDVLNEDVMPSQQGTQIDALGHFASIDETWDGESELRAGDAQYYGGFTQGEVKPTPGSPLLKLGMEKAPPIVTSAVLLDAKKHVGGGQAMKAGEVVTAEHLEAMLEAQGLAERGILAGDVVLVYTGWSDRYRDPDTEKVYYSAAPGLSYDAAKYLGERRVVAAGLDTPFVDPVAEGQLAGEAGPPPGTPEGLLFAVHDYFLTEAGVHTLENLNLSELARDGVSTSCAMILPLRVKGSAGSPIRPVAIGAPGR